MSDSIDRSPPTHDENAAAPPPPAASFEADPLWYDTETEPDRERSRLGPVAVGGIVLVGIGVVAWMVQS